MRGSFTIGAAQMIVASFREQLQQAERRLRAAQLEVDLRAADLSRAESLLAALEDEAK